MTCTEAQSYTGGLGPQGKKAKVPVSQVPTSKKKLFYVSGSRGRFRFGADLLRRSVIGRLKIVHPLRVDKVILGLGIQEVETAYRHTHTFLLFKGMVKPACDYSRTGKGSVELGGFRGSARSLLECKLDLHTLIDKIEISLHEWSKSSFWY